MFDLTPIDAAIFKKKTKTIQMLIEEGVPVKEIRERIENNPLLELVPEIKSLLDFHDKTTARLETFERFLKVQEL